MYYVTPENAAQPDLARDFIALATSPEVQAEGIVKRFNWYPGIDAQNPSFTQDQPEDGSSLFQSLITSNYLYDISDNFFRNLVSTYLIFPIRMNGSQD
jgi:ABC-type glycerol-3-phosphate transport system substrate-binding protein